MLILDFDFVEQGVAAGLPERESWRAAFGLTVTLVWLYIELLRILAILRGRLTSGRERPVSPENRPFVCSDQLARRRRSAVAQRPC